MRVSAFRTRVILTLLCSIALAGCGEREEEKLTGVRTRAVEAAGAAAPAPADEWLAMDERTPPATFLAQATGGDEAELAPLLESLSTRYRESPRMIANRLVQVWRETRASDPDLTAARLLHDFAPPPATPGAAPVESVGPAVQQYFVLRRQGASHEAAVSAALGGATP